MRKIEEKVKQYLDKNVYEMAIERMEYIFDNFKKVYFSFSAGKDSSVGLHIALEVARKKNRLPLDVLFIDLEAQYKKTIEHAEEMLLNNPDINAYWICLPMNLRNAVSVFQPYWTCWNSEEKDRWVRDIPAHKCVISDPNYFPFFREKMEFEDFVVKFGMWFAGDTPTACAVFIRAQESLHRYLAIFKVREESKFQGVEWTTQVRKNVYNFFPLYDWKTEDIWTAVGKNNWSYNKIYDFMYLSGMSINEARICQPYGDDQRQGLDLFKLCEPETWAKVVDRVAGANFGNIYCKSYLLGHRKTHLPDNYTWKKYSEFLLETIPKFLKHWYLERIEKFGIWWENEGYPADKWFDAIPEKTHPAYEKHDQLPCWERVAKCILKNDILCKTISFGQSPRSWDKYQEMKATYGYDKEEVSL